MKPAECKYVEGTSKEEELAERDGEREREREMEREIERERRKGTYLLRKTRLLAHPEIQRYYNSNVELEAGSIVPA